MNLLLLEAGELDHDGRAVLTGRRADHLREVLRAAVGDTLRAGVVDGELGEAVVEQITPAAAVVRVRLGARQERTSDTLMLACPRPKVLLRMLAHAAAMGYARIVIFRTWRVDKTWMQSRACDPAVQREQLILGLEQGGRTQMPELLRFDRFKPMVQDELPRLDLPELRFVAHPNAATSTSELLPSDTPYTLAIGPDGGFLPYEVDMLHSAGFTPITLGEHPLRTEAALAALWGQLDLLRRTAQAPQT